LGDRNAGIATCQMGIKRQRWLGSKLCFGAEAGTPTKDRLKLSNSFAGVSTFPVADDPVPFRHSKPT
jgi:hypothetical protein